MSGSYVLIFVALTYLTGSPRPVSFAHDFNSKEACEAAKESIRQKATDVRINLLTCEKK